MAQFLTLNTIHRSLFTVSATLFNPLEKFSPSFVSNFTWVLLESKFPTLVSKEKLNFHNTLFGGMGVNKV